jgi:putative PIN family toxin of toxin-antitoxin system
MRAVIDTNVLLSGLLWYGPPHTLIEHIRAGSLSLISSPGLLAEFSAVVRRAKFQPILARSAIRPDHLLAELERLAELVDPPPLPIQISRDPDDDAVLALAAMASADMIISGDADLLAITQYAGIRIVTPAGALRIITAA